MFNLNPINFSGIEESVLSLLSKMATMWNQKVCGVPRSTCSTYHASTYHVVLTSGTFGSNLLSGLRCSLDDSDNISILQVFLMASIHATELCRWLQDMSLCRYTVTCLLFHSLWLFGGVVPNKGPLCLWAIEIRWGVSPITLVFAYRDLRSIIKPLCDKAPTCKSLGGGWLGS